jgi:hypothetical protein
LRDKRLRPAIRVGLDGLAVLLAILLAFGIDAMWEVRAEQDAVRDLLGALETEWRSELEKLNTEIEGIARNRAAIAVMVEVNRTAEHGITPDSARALYQAMSWVTYKPALGAVNSLLLTDLENVRDLALRSAIAAWPGVLEEAAPEKQGLEELGLILARHDLARIAHSLGTPWATEEINTSGLFGVELADLALAAIADETFIIRLRQVHSVLYTYETDLRGVRETLRFNLGLFDPR